MKEYEIFCSSKIKIVWAPRFHINNMDPDSDKCSLDCDLCIILQVYSSELNCLGSVREGTKLVVGSGEGTLYLFNQGSYGYHSDQYPGHPDSINSLLSVTDNVVLTGCEDGSIRAVHLFPHRFIGNVSNAQTGGGGGGG